MRDEPDDLRRQLLARELRAHWGFEVHTLEYAPVGAGSYHWRAEEAGGRRWFITADNLRSLGAQDGVDVDANFRGLEAAYQTAAALRDAGLPFVVAPIATKAGQVVRRILPDWAVAAFPLIEGESGPWRWTNAASRTIAAGLIGQLHRVRPPAVLPRWEPTIPHRGALLDAFDALGRPWGSGPYGERTRELLAASRDGIEALLRKHDQLVQALDSSREPWVVTHGEPHSANFITGDDGNMHLIDWDTVRLGPRERDLWIVAGDDREALDAYEAAAGPFTPGPEAMALFDLRWQLADICVYIRWFRQPHGDSDDDRACWEELAKYLPVESKILDRKGGSMQ